MKICKVCKTSKQLDAFYALKRNKDGYNNWCKECTKKMANKYSEQQKQKHAQTPPNQLPKLCPACNVVKPFKEFHKDHKNKTGLTSWCNVCRGIKTKEWIKNNPEKAKSSRRNTNLKRLYRITLKDYEKMLQDQQGTCAICKTTDPGGAGKKFVVDHCHSTDKVRALLCGKCNCAIGLLNEDPLLFDAAKQYLQNYK
jgi:Recombination endonuclease VII